MSCRWTPTCRTRAARPGRRHPVPRGPGYPPVPVIVFDDGVLRVTAVAVTHGQAVPALAYRFDTADGSVVFSGDTTVNDDLIALARDADILVHQVADLDYLERHGTGVPNWPGWPPCIPMSAVGGVAERAGARADPQPLSAGGTGRHHRRAMGAASGARLRRHHHRRPRRPAQDASLASPALTGEKARAASYLSGCCQHWRRFLSATSHLSAHNHKQPAARPADQLRDPSVDVRRLRAWEPQP